MKLKKEYLIRALWVALGLILYSLIYEAIQRIRHEGVSIATTLDFAIPFIPVFVLFYALWYPVVIAPFLLSIKQKHLFKKTAISFGLIVGFSFATFILFQTEISRAVVGSADFFSRMVLFVYHHDLPLNCFPSLHVSGSVLANLCTMNFNKKLGLIMIPLTVLIVLSTLFIKQHFIFDVLGGILLALGSYLLVFKIDWLKLKEQILASRV